MVADRRLNSDPELATFLSVLDRMPRGVASVESSSVFAHDTLPSFLQHHVRARRDDTRWTLRGWARALGLRHAATLTRIITGDRAPGDRLGEVLLSQFGFSEAEARYFRCLIQRSRTTDPALQLLIEEKQRIMRMHSHPDIVSRVMEAGTILCWQGEGSEAAVRQILPAGAPLEPLAIDGRVPIALNVCNYDKTTAGRYGDRYIAVAMREIGVTDRWGFLFLDRISTDRSLAALGQFMLGLDAQLGEVGVEVTPTGVRAVVQEPTGETTLEMRQSPGVGSRCQLEVFGFGRTSFGWGSFRLEISTDRWETPYSAEQDPIVLQPAVRQRLDELDFRPRMWSLMTNLTCAMYFPRLLAPG